MGRDAEVARSRGKRDEPSEQKKRIEHEHRRIRSSLELLEQATDLGAILQTLRDLKPLLEHHFAHEEGNDGIHDIIGLTAPNLVPSVQDLFDEHKQFLELLGELTSEVARAREIIFAGRDRLIHGLRSHEERETELFSQAAYSELGAGD